jgi:hypothetical protein
LGSASCLSPPLQPSEGTDKRITAAVNSTAILTPDGPKLLIGWFLFSLAAMLLLNTRRYLGWYESIAVIHSGVLTLTSSESTRTSLPWSVAYASKVTE